MTPLPDGFMAQWARWYFEQGWPVFPIWPPAHDGDQWLDHCSCRNGVRCPDPCKHPRVKTYFGKISGLDVDLGWSQNPTSSIAIRCDSLTVVDLDGPKGRKAFRELRESHGAPPPETPTTRTGGGGYHLYFKTLSGARNKVKLLPGVDIRADDGYVIAPPSRTLKGSYEWVEGKEPWTVPLAVVPPWLADLIVGPEEEKPPRETGPRDPWEPNLDAFPDIYDGSRNNDLVKVCGSLFNAYSGGDSLPYFEVAEQVEKAIRIVNERKVHPPVENNELAKIISNMVKRNERKRRET
jgi:hypothetical protein